MGRIGDRSRRSNTFGRRVTDLVQRPAASALQGDDQAGSQGDLRERGGQ
jgi:hypothetical protein